MSRIIFLSLILITTVIAQNPEWIVYNTSNSGIPRNHVRSLATDNAGDKWIGTYSRGLTSFDGTNWTVFEPNSDILSNYIGVIAIDENGTKWMDASTIMSEGRIGHGLMSFDGSNWTVYDTSNSDLPYIGIQAITVDNDGTKWIGTGDICGNGTGCESGGLVSFNGSNWTVYDTSNTDLPDNHINVIAIEENGTKWIGVSAEGDLGPYGYGLASFDGSTWTVYDTSNSDIPGNYVSTIAIDTDGTKWIGFPGTGWSDSHGLASFDGTTWTVYDTSNSDLPSNHVVSIAIDDNGVKWIGAEGWSGGGLASFDGSNWTVYDTSNSDIPVNYVSTIAIDDYGNKWIGTSNGLAVFNEGGVVGIDDKQRHSSHPIDFILNQNYPNPFNPSTTIQYSLPEAGSIKLTIFDILGQEVTTLRDGSQSRGNCKVQWNGMDQSGNPVSTGVYFARLEAGEYSHTIKMLYLK